MTWLVRKLTYANVMATIAVFVALGGASYAASQIPNNSVGTNQLKNGAVATAKLQGTSVTTNKIAKEAVTGAKVKLSTLGAVPTAKLAENASALGGLNSAQVINQAITGAKVQCPAGTTASTGVCFSAVHGALNWYEAIDACAKEGKTLPTAAELHAFGRIYNPPNPGGPFEWTGNALSTTTALEIGATVSSEGAGEGKVFGDFLPFHCVGYPVN
jgi:hypothetical protein